MSKNYLPTHVNPERLAENAMTLHGHMLVKNMERLASSLQDVNSEAEIELQFGRDQGVRFLKGTVAANLSLQCQRCMEPFPHEVAGEFAYGMVTSEERAKKLNQLYDPLIVQDENLNIQDLIEEELIINLPIVPMHCSEDCKVQMPLIVASDTEEKMEKQNPFRVIESLRVKTKED